MSDLVTWLLEQIGEDDRQARFVASQWDEPRASHETGSTLGWDDEYDLLTINPERVLAECAAKRRIIENAERAELHYRSRGDAAAINMAGIVETYRSILRLLALPYTDRPGYRDEWRPS